MERSASDISTVVASRTHLQTNKVCWADPLTRDGESPDCFARTLGTDELAAVHADIERYNVPITQ